LHNTVKKTESNGYKEFKNTGINVVTTWPYGQLSAPQR